MTRVYRNSFQSKKNKWRIYKINSYQKQKTNETIQKSGNAILHMRILSARVRKTLSNIQHTFK